ncbi:MAG: amidohydrolase family protein [Chloroflexi bacterium]|nr:amidohydrolase family protein [Chloroflexota bacterium]
MKYDLVITGAHVIDPASGTDRVAAVAVKDGLFAAVGDAIDPAEAERVVDASGKYLSPGWFDMHVHVYSNLAFSDPDTIGVLHGVTTMIDAGGSGVWTYQDYREYWEGQCKTEVYSFIHDNPVGILTGTREDLGNRAHTNKDVPPEEFRDIVEANRDRILAIKSGVHTYNGFGRVKDAWVIADMANLPRYLHVGDIRRPHGERFTREAMDTLRAGDCFTHVYTGNWGGMLDDDGKVLPEVLAALKRGVASDVGFGGLNFSFEAYDALMAQGIVADVISSDLQGVNVTGPCHSLAHVMSLFLNNGYALNDVIQRVTINPAKLRGLDGRIGSLRVGLPARVTVFDVEAGDYTFRDTKGLSRQGGSMIVPRWCLMDGEIIESDDAPGLEQGNWSFMPRLDDAVLLAPGVLDQEQTEFAHLLATGVQGADWDNGLAVQVAYKQTLKEAGIDHRKAANTVYDLLLESRFSTPPGWLMSAMQRESVLHRLQSA